MWYEQGKMESKTLMETGRHGSEKRTPKARHQIQKNPYCTRDNYVGGLKLGMIPVSPKSAVAPLNWELL
jgi:hypothetical protein